MNSNHEVISAFLDDEPFDPEALAEALEDPAGLALLIDSIVLRRIVQPIDAVPAIRRPPAARSVWRPAAAAAAFLVALAGGYVAGDRRASTSSSDAPPPTRVVQAVPFVPAGGM